MHSIDIGRKYIDNVLENRKINDFKIVTNTMSIITKAKSPTTKLFNYEMKNGDHLEIGVNLKKQNEVLVEVLPVRGHVKWSKSNHLTSFQFSLCK